MLAVTFQFAGLQMGFWTAIVLQNLDAELQTSSQQAILYSKLSKGCLFGVPNKNKRNITAVYNYSVKCQTNTHVPSLSVCFLRAVTIAIEWRLY